MKLSRPKRIAVHSILMAGSILFLFPFVWLVTTSLKPIEQTMKMPPDWLPRAYYAPVQGQRLQVVKEREFAPQLLVRIEEDPWKGAHVLVPVSGFRDGIAEVPVEMLRTIRTGPSALPESARPRAGPRPAIPSQGPPLRAQIVLEIPAPCVIVEITDDKWRRERLWLPSTQFRGGVAQVPVEVLRSIQTVDPSAAPEDLKGKTVKRVAKSTETEGVKARKVMEIAEPSIVVELLEGKWKGERFLAPSTRFRHGPDEVPPEGIRMKTEERVARSTETVRLRAEKTREIFEPFAIVEPQEGKRKGERLLLPSTKFREGLAEVETRVGDRTVTQRVRATLQKQVGKGYRLVRERFERLAQETAPLLLTPEDVRDLPAFCTSLQSQGSAQSPSPAGRLWRLLPAAARTMIEDAAGKPRLDEKLKAEIVEALNAILKQPDLYQEQSFPVLALPDEARGLLQRDRQVLSPQEIQRLNRLLLETAFPKQLASTQAEWLTARWDCVPAEQVEEKIQPAWWNYQGAIRYTGYYRFSLFGRPCRIPMFLVYLWNTLTVALLGVIGVTFSSALAAYGFARIPWKGRETCFLITLATMMVPFAVTMVPLYGVYRALGWIGSLKPLWVPAFFGGAFNIFLLRQFFRTIPQDLSDAARIDGCSEFGIFWRIILPLSRPALAVVALFHFMWAWNDFMGPLIYLTKQDTYTLSLGLQFYQSQHGGSEWHFLMAAATMMILPIIALFFFTQRTFIQGISTTGLKG